MFSWVGSKKRIVEDIVAYMPEKIETYCEPFMGAAHVGLFLLENEIIKKKAFLSDKNEDLVCFWIALQNDPDELYERINKLSYKLNKKDFLWLRERRPTSVTSRGAWFYYLVKNSYRGLWRVNSENIFNVAYNGCRFEDFMPDKQEMRRISKLLDPSIVTIESMDFREALKPKRKNTVYYLDPPYYNTFSSYTSDKFTKHDHNVLAWFFNTLKKRGNVVILSNIDDPYIRDLYRKHEIHEIKINHSTSVTGGSEETTELLIK